MLAEAPVELLGCPTPRIAPPRPLRHDLDGYRAAAASFGIDPMPWQDTAATYITATAPDGLWLYREVPVVVGRQNGKTTLTKPLIGDRLVRQGRRILHIAQVRELPRIMFEQIADHVEEVNPDLFPKRRGKIIWPRRGAGSESIVLTNGGTYRIAAAGRGGARGQEQVDDLFIDELREMETWEVINAAKPAQRFSVNPQTIYLSNAGTDDSVVLNALRDRAGADPSLAYLEWSADPDYDPGDRRGWAQSNPAIGHFPQVLRDLEKDYLAARLSGNLNGFRTEALCQWVKTLRQSLVDVADWNAREAHELEAGRRVYMGVSTDPERSRASAALAWQQPDGRVAVLPVLEESGSPVDTAAVGDELRRMARRKGVREVGVDPMTDGELAKFFPKSKVKPISGPAFAVACSSFVDRVKGDGLRWKDAATVTDDLTWTARKENDETGVFSAVRANDDRPITSVLAVIRAVGLATGPRPAAPRIY